jgi:hypothetical protein
LNTNEYDHTYIDLKLFSVSVYDKQVSFGWNLYIKLIWKWDVALTIAVKSIVKFYFDQNWYCYYGDVISLPRVLEDVKEGNINLPLSRVRNHFLQNADCHFVKI